MKSIQKNEIQYLITLSVLSGMIVAGFGFVALLGWFLQFPLLATFGKDLVPMAPSTAILFVLLGVVLFLYNFPPTKGIELAAAEGLDVILLDIIMPGVDGFDIYRKLKADKKLCDIPEVFVTVLGIDKERVENNKIFTIKLKELRQ